MKSLMPGLNDIIAFSTRWEGNHISGKYSLDLSKIPEMNLYSVVHAELCEEFDNRMEKK